MTKRMTGLVAGGFLAGAAIVGIPTLALAQPEAPQGRAATETESEVMQGMGSMMSDPQFRNQMKAFMGEMMSDQQLREQMRSMMSDSMGDMGSGQMGDMMRGSGMGESNMGGSGADGSRPQDDQTP